MELLSKILGPNLVPGSGERRALVPPKPPEHISFSAPLNQGCCALLKTPRRTLPAWHNSWQHYDDGGCCSDVTNDIKRVDLSLAFFGAVVAVWSTIFTELWKRRNGFLNVWWGTVDAEKEERERPEFVGQYKKDPITNRVMLHMSSTARLKSSSSASNMRGHTASTRSYACTASESSPLLS